MHRLGRIRSAGLKGFMDLGCKGKTALVLAGGGGLGRAIGKALAAEGANVGIADIDEGAANRSADEIKKTGATALSIVWDLAALIPSDSDVSAGEPSRGPMDVLVNIPGGPPPTPAQEKN